MSKGLCRAGVRLAMTCALLLAATASPVRAQAGTASLQGTVVDAQGAVLPGVTVTLTNTATGDARTAITSGTGDYQLIALPPGRYRLSAELSGFQTAIVETVRLAVDTTSRVDVKMQLGNLSETVQVTGESPAINTTDASLGNVIDGSQIRALPLEARNVTGLLSLQPGVTYVPKTNPDSVDPRYGAVSGARPDQSNVTLDGIDVNDAQNQSAFTSVLRVTLDSVQEFRVSTSNYGADFGRSSGAQVSLVTRSGTNRFSGAGYWVNRDTRFSSNEYFLKLSQLETGQPNEAPLLNKNIGGFSIGGPILHDKLFFFGNFEGLNEKRETPVTRDVPTASFRDGVLMYQCAVPAACPGGSVSGFTASHAVPAGYYGMTPADLTRVDPLHIGPSQAALAYFNQLPLPNETGSYPYNVDTLRFAAPLENTFRTYISRFDYKMGGGQSLFGRINFQDDTTAAVPQFPGDPPSSTGRVKNRGFAVGYDSVLGSNKVNTLRYGYTLVDNANLGLLSANRVTFRFIDEITAPTSSRGRKLGTHNIVDDFSWVKGAHTLKFGTNLRFVRNDQFSNANSFHSATANGSWTFQVGRRYMPGGSAGCPAPANCSGLPDVAPGGQSSYADMFIDILGAITEADASWNYGIDGSVLPSGEPIRRLYAADEYEGYVQDSWRVRDNLTVTAGLRYSLFSPPYEANGIQVAPSISLGQWFEQRGENAANGVPANASDRIDFVPAGPKHDRPGYYAWDKNNFAPRVAVAWTPTDRTVIRGGYALVYDRIGAGIATSFDAGGSFGLSTQLSSPVNQHNEDDPSIRFQGVSTLPPTLPAAPPGRFPAGPANFEEGGITQAIDDTVTTPYSHVLNAVIGRDLGRGFSLEAAYVGRFGHDLLVRRDLAMASNLVDTKSGTDYFTAARQMIDAFRASGDPTTIAPIPYWENLFPSAAHDGLSATQAIAASFADAAPDWQTALWVMDRFCAPGCSIFGPGAFFTEQYDALAALSSIGRSNYHAMQLSLRKRFTAGYQFDVNYTYSVAKDDGSEVERGSLYDNFDTGGYSGFLINSWEPERNYSYADFDVRHQLNLNYLLELPFGRGKMFGGNAGSALNAIIGDWAVAGIFRVTSGFPFNVQNCRSCWATNWNLQGNAELVDPSQLPETRQNRNAVNGRPSPFADPETAIDFFRRDYPGEAGIRNLLRGDGYLGTDLSISKAFHMPFGHMLRFRWDIFNLTNTVRFDVAGVSMLPDRAASFGRYNGSLATCDGAAGRCMQANLRYEW